MNNFLNNNIIQKLKILIIILYFQKFKQTILITGLCSSKF